MLTKKVLTFVKKVRFSSFFFIFATSVIRRIVYILLFYVLLVSNAAFSRGIKTNNSDTVSVLNQVQHLLSEYDSTLMFPAFELYCQWDTLTIHPYEFGQGSLKDTSVINLVDEYNCGYVPPFCGEISSNFGARKGRPHYGVDINLETGDSVVAAFGGMVRIAKRNKTFGNVVIIRHSNGLETFYAHLSKLKVSANQYVEPGQLIGLGGNTGHSYGSHLHFEVRYKGLPINPNDLISFEKNQLLSNTLVIDSKSFEFSAKIEAKKTNTKSAKSKYYTVRKGDTLYAIAKRHGTTPQKLCKINNIRMSATLRVGMKIKCA